MHRILRIASISLFCVLIGATGADGRASANYGKFEGNLVFQANDDGRTMTLVRDYVYIDPKGTTWRAPAGSKVDGASIPRFAWSFIGGPYEGKYRNASVIHDIACIEKIRPWERVHETFYYAMLASGVETLTAKIMYAAVYHFGPRWLDPDKPHLPFGDPESLATEPDPQQLEADRKEFDDMVIKIRENENSASPMTLQSIQDLKPASIPIHVIF